jgi:sugar phosphate isomerase/epimerase
MNQTRRNFLKNTAVASAIPMITPFTELVANPTNVKAKAGFELLFMQTDWGFAGTTDEFCAATKKDGYDGIEVWWPGEDRAPQLFEAVKKHGLQIGFLSSGYQVNPKEHIATFKKNIEEICANKFQKPLYINCHSGKDYFTYEENKAIIDYTISKSKSSGIPIYHETHRSRMMFAAHVAKNFAEKNPDVRFTLDISHWCNVHESLLGDQKETIDFILSKTEHIHSRIGHSQGPQVNDPRAPEWEGAVKAHLAWWDKVIERKKKNGERMTILTEFGPADYMPTLPYTRQPVANQWAVNVHMKDLLKKRYL